MPTHTAATLHDTPRLSPPQPPAETESVRNPDGTVFGMAHEIGYARVSKREQNPDAQEAELRAAGCERVFVDHGESRYGCRDRRHPAAFYHRGIYHGRIRT